VNRHLSQDRLVALLREATGIDDVKPGRRPPISATVMIRKITDLEWRANQYDASGPLAIAPASRDRLLMGDSSIATSSAAGQRD